MSPQRIQLRRVKGYRKPEGAVVVSRPSKWGNPWTVSEWLEVLKTDEDDARNMAVSCFRYAMEDRITAELNGEAPEAHEREDFYPPLTEVRNELRGKDLACWCPLEDGQGHRAPCHADVLLVLANPEVTFPWAK